MDGGGTNNNDKYIFIEHVVLSLISSASQHEERLRC